MTEKIVPRERLVPPGPVVENLLTSASHRVVVSWFRRATLVEFEDTLFRHESAVMMPAGEKPSELDGDGRHRTAVGLAATVLRYVDEHPGVQVVVAGHTDTTGGDAYNLQLSQWRAECVTAVLTGDAATFAKICNDWRRMKVEDYQQILTWLAEERGWDCDPGGIDGVHGNDTQTAVNNFRQAYNEEGPGASWAPKVTPYGPANNDETWRAYFNCYEEALMAELDEDFDGLATLRAKLAFATPQRFVGCGENHPKEAENVDEFRSQTNRRVEVVIFEPGEVPAFGCHPAPGACNPDQCELYDRQRLRQRVLPPMLSAKRWHARWDGDTAQMNSTRAMTLLALGLPAGVPLTFTVKQEEHGDVAELEAVSAAESAIVPFDAWEHPKSYAYAGTLGPDDPFPEVRFSYVVEGAGRRVEGDAIVYRDRLHVQLVVDDGGVLGNQPIQVVSPWGTRELRSDPDGIVDVPDLPPGGASVVLRDRTLVHLGELPFDWHGDEP